MVTTMQHDAILDRPKNPVIEQWAKEVDWLELESNLLNYLLGRAEENVRRIDEYALIQWLDTGDIFESLNVKSAGLQLFVKHYTVRRCLYSLRKSFFDLGYQIKFELMHFELHTLDAPALAGSNIALASDQLIAAFYGDLNTLLCATDDSVNKLLADFWVKYDAYQKADSAYEILGVSIDASWLQIQQAYRSLASVHHPDKGGAPEKFVAIKGAYDQLKTLRAGN